LCSVVTYPLSNGVLGRFGLDAPAMAFTIPPQSVLVASNAVSPGHPGLTTRLAGGIRPPSSSTLRSAEPPPRFRNTIPWMEVLASALGGRAKGVQTIGGDPTKQLPTLSDSRC
jgi:hypothetical protein